MLDKSYSQLLSGLLMPVVAMFAISCTDSSGKFTGVVPPPGVETPEEEIPIYVSSLVPSNDIGVFVTTDGDDGDNGTKANPFATIQHALDNIGEKDYVFVAGGTYTDNVTATGTGKIYGSYDKAFKVQDPLKTPTFMRGNSPALVVSATGSIVAVGLRFIPEAVLDAVTTVVNLGKLAIARSSVKGQGSDGCNGDSRAIYNEGSLKVQSSVIQGGNVDCDDSIGIENNGGGDVDISLTTIQAGNSDSDDSIGIYQDNEGTLNIRGSRIYSNMADGTAYGVYSEQGDVLVSSSTFKPLNHDSDTYGIYADEGMFRVGDSVFDLGFDNVGDNEHYGIYLKDGGNDQADLYSNEVRNDGGACVLYGIYVEDVSANISNLSVDFGENRSERTVLEQGVGDIDIVEPGERDAARLTDDSASFNSSYQFRYFEIASGFNLGEYRIWHNPTPGPTSFRIWDSNSMVAESDVKYEFVEDDDNCTSQGVYREDEDESHALSVKNSQFNMGTNLQIAGVMSKAYDDDDTVAPETNILDNTFNGTGAYQYVGISLENGYIRVQNNMFAMTMNEMKAFGTTGWGIRIDGERFDPIVDGETQVWISDNVITGGYSSQKFGLHLDGDEGSGEMKMLVTNNQVECGMGGGTARSYGRCVAMKMDLSQVAVIEDNDFFAGPQNPNASAEYQAGHFDESVIVESRRNHYRTDAIDLPARITGLKIEEDAEFLSENDRITVGPTGKPVYPNCDPDDDEDDDEGPRCARYMVFGANLEVDSQVEIHNGVIDVADAEGANVVGLKFDEGESSSDFQMYNTVVKTGTAGKGSCFYDEDQEGEDDLHYDDCDNIAVSLGDVDSIIEDSTMLAGEGRLVKGLENANAGSNRPIWVADSVIGTKSANLHSFGIFQDSQTPINISDSLVWAGPAMDGTAYGWFFGRDFDEEVDNDEKVSCGGNYDGIDADGTKIAASGAANKTVGIRLGECSSGSSDRRLVNNEIAASGPAMIHVENGNDQLDVDEINDCNFTDCDDASGNVESAESADALSPFGEE